MGEDKAYDTADHVAHLRAINVTPHVTQNDSITATGKRRQSAIDGRTTRHEGYGMSQSCRAMIECIFGWGKQHGTMRKTKHRGLASVATDFMLNLIAYNLSRTPVQRCPHHVCFPSDSDETADIRIGGFGPVAEIGLLDLSILLVTIRPV